MKKYKLVALDENNSEIYTGVLKFNNIDDTIIVKIPLDYPSLDSTDKILDELIRVFPNKEIILVNDNIHFFKLQEVS